MAFCGEKNQKLLFEVGSLLKFRKFLPHTPYLTGCLADCYYTQGAALG